VLSFAVYEVITLTANNNTDQTDDTDTTDGNPTQSPTSTTNSPTTTTTPTATPTTTGTNDQDTDTTTHEQNHEAATDYTYDASQATNITLNQNSITTDSSNAVVDGNAVTLTASGTYRITGTLTNGQVIVNSTDKGTVQLILSNVDISCSNSAPINVIDAKKVVVILEEGTTNTLKDIRTTTTDDVNAALYSTCDLTIYGTGTLTVTSNNDGITGKDGLIIKSGTVTVNAGDDGIRGKDYLIVKDGQITITAAGNGLLSDNTDNATRGYVTIEAGTINITANGDAVSAATDVTITGGQITATTAGGASGSTTESAKTIKGLSTVTISGGTFTLNSADDALHSNGTITINGGTFTIQTGDDGIHADSAIIINGGTINIAKSYEGIESVTITINGGNINLKASDDGINGAGGNDASGTVPGPGRGGPGQDNFMNTGNCALYVNGGYVVVESGGDGIDINGAVTMTAGTVIVNGPTDNGNGALDFSSFKMTDGYLVAVGSSGMAQSLSTTSTQYSVLINFKSSYTAGTLIHIQSSTGSDIVTFKAAKQFQSIVVCSPSLQKGTTYDVYVGGSSTGTLQDGVYSGGTYTAGTKYTSFTISSIITTVR
jgi:hypothetical protein